VGFRFQRRIKILPGLAINISKSGVGFSPSGGYGAACNSDPRSECSDCSFARAARSEIEGLDAGKWLVGVATLKGAGR
jgi:hypothetical protein